MSTPTAEPKRRRRWLIAVELALLACLLLAAPFINQMWAIRDAAADTFPAGLNSRGAMHPDNIHRLASYTPRQLVRYLHAPIATWRGAVCTVLLSMDAHWVNPDWDGVALTLGRTALTDPEAAVRNLAWRALRRVAAEAGIPAADAAALLGLAPRGQPGAERREVLALVAQNCSDCKERLHMQLLAWIESPQREDKLDGAELLAQLFPGDAKLGPSLTAFANDSSVASEQLLALVQTAARSNPSLLADWLTGNERQQTIALQALKSNAASAIAAKAEAPASKALTAENESLRAAAVDFLLSTPQGAARLVQQLRGLNSMLQAAILQRMAAANLSPRLRFEGPEASALVQFLTSADLSVRAAAGSFIEKGFNNRFAPGTGPLDPTQRTVFATLLQDPELELNRLALTYFARTTPLVPADVPAVLKLAQQEREDLALAATTQLVNRFPDDPQVNSFAGTAIENPKVNPHVLQAVCIPLLGRTNRPAELQDRLVRRYHQSAPADQDKLDGLLIACATKAGPMPDSTIAQEVWQRYLKRVEGELPSPGAAQAGAVPAGKTAKQGGSPGKAAKPTGKMGGMAKAGGQPGGAGGGGGGGPPAAGGGPPMQAGPPGGARLTGAPTGPPPLRDPPYLEMVRLVGRDNAQAGLEAFFTRILAQEGRVPVEVVGDFCRKFGQAIPVSDIAAKIAKAAQAQEPARVRARGVDLIKEARPITNLAREVAIAALGDAASEVRCSAIEAIGGLEIRDPPVLQKLQELCVQGETEFLRAESLRSLARLAPTDPQTFELTKKLFDDPERSVRSFAHIVFDQLSKR